MRLRFGLAVCAVAASASCAGHPKVAPAKPLNDEHLSVGQLLYQDDFVTDSDRWTPEPEHGGTVSARDAG